MCRYHLPKFNSLLKDAEGEWHNWAGEQPSWQLHIHFFTVSVQLLPCSITLKGAPPQKNMLVLIYKQLKLNLLVLSKKSIEVQGGQRQGQLRRGGGVRKVSGRWGQWVWMLPFPLPSPLLLTLDQALDTVLHKDVAAKEGLPWLKLCRSPPDPPPWSRVMFQGTPSTLARLCGFPVRTAT